MRRSPLRSVVSAALCVAFFVQSTGAADLAPMFARGMMLPPPGRMAPMPAPAKPSPEKSVKPAGEPWLASAAVVARWVSARLTEFIPAEPAPMPAAETLAVFSGAAATEVAAVASLPSPEPPADRMLIAMEGRRVLASGLAIQLASILQYRSELKPLRPRFIGEWVGRGPVRARVDYLNPFGVTQGESGGFRVTLSDGSERVLAHEGPIPDALRQERPLYFVGDLVDVEVSLRNTGPTPLTNLIVSSAQEMYNASGRAGARVAAPTANTVKTLAPGETAILRWRIKLSASGVAAVNFEQTHLRVLGKDSAGTETVLLDEAQAGIVDPPSL